MSKLVQVLSLTHSFFVDVRPMVEGGDKVIFHEMLVSNPDPESHPESKVYLGVAQVREDVYKEFYEKHRSFQLYVEGPRSSQEIPDISFEEEVEETPPEDGEGTEEGSSEDSESSNEEEADDEVPPVGNPLAGVNFRTDRGGEVAAQMGLTSEDFSGMDPSGKGGSFTVQDVRKANKRKATSG